jgi:hypothetical protein
MGEHACLSTFGRGRATYYEPASAGNEDAMQSNESITKPVCLRESHSLLGDDADQSHRVTMNTKLQTNLAHPSTSLRHSHGDGRRLQIFLSIDGRQQFLLVEFILIGRPIC